MFFGVPDVKSDYNALISSLTTRFYKGVSLIANYTFGKSLDTASWEAPCGCTNQTFPGRSGRGIREIGFRYTPQLQFQCGVGPSFLFEPKLVEGKDPWRLADQHDRYLQHRISVDPADRQLSAGSFSKAAATSAIRGRPALTERHRQDNSDEDFLSGGPFPGSFIGGNCATPAPGCNSVFRTYFPFNASPLDFPPAVGRNSFFGPKYFNTDLSDLKAIRALERDKQYRSEVQLF